MTPIRLIMHASLIRTLSNHVRFNVKMLVVSTD